jgi:hypothetical protein
MRNAMLHLIKLCVGCDSVAQLADWQARRARTDPPLRHQTRSMPRRAAEIVGQGSLYWVIGGAILVRQRITDIIADRWDDGTACAGLVLDSVLVPTEPRLMRPFQGWRYLEPAEAPPDRPAGLAEAQEPFGEMPAAMRRELRALGLL